MANFESGNPKIVAFGGGTGTPPVVEALEEAGLIDEEGENLIAVPAVFDSGGVTGLRRTINPAEISHGDSKRVVQGLFSREQRGSSLVRHFLAIFNSRKRGVDIGQEMFAQFWSPERGYADIEEHIKGLGIRLRGRMKPATVFPAHTGFRTVEGIEYSGEDKFDMERMSDDVIDEMYLYPSVPAFPETVQAVEDADIVILCPGSTHGSILSNFLPVGMKEAMMNSKAKLVVIANLMSTRNEARTPEEFVALIEKYTGRVPDLLIIPKITREEFEAQNERTARIYSQRGQRWFDWHSGAIERLTQRGIKFVEHDALGLEPVNNHYEVRHEPANLALAITQAVGVL